MGQDLANLALDLGKRRERPRTSPVKFRRESVAIIRLDFRPLDRCFGAQPPVNHPQHFLLRDKFRENLRLVHAERVERNLVSFRRRKPLPGFFQLFARAGGGLLVRCRFGRGIYRQELSLDQALADRLESLAVGLVK